ALAAMVSPPVVAPGLVDPDFRRSDDAAGEIRHNQAEVSWLGDHRMPRVSVALPRRAGMGVDVRDRVEPEALAQIPEGTERRAAESADPGVQCVRVKVVIVGEPKHFTAAAIQRAAEKE